MACSLRLVFQLIQTLAAVTLGAALLAAYQSEQVRRTAGLPRRRFTSTESATDSRSLERKAPQTVDVGPASTLLPSGQALHDESAQRPIIGQPPSAEVLAIAERARNVKVFVYDLEAAGLQVAPSGMAASSQACECNVSTSHHAGFAHDPCNHLLGHLSTSHFAHFYQGNLFRNHHNGLDIAAGLHARLLAAAGHAHSRVVSDPKDADLFFIPLYVNEACYAHNYDYLDACGPQYGDGASGTDVRAMWRWLLDQPSFADSDGSDHFMILEAPLSFLRHGCPHLFRYRKSDYGKAGAEKLHAMKDSINILTTDVSYTQSENLPSNVHIVPFATNFHYVPSAPGFDVAQDSASLRALEQSRADTATSDDGITGPPPRRGGGWQPGAFVALQRPLLAAYVGMDSRGDKSLMREQKWGWAVKRQVHAACMAASDSDCFAFRLEDRAASAAALVALPGIEDAAAQIGYGGSRENGGSGAGVDLAALERDAAAYVTLVGAFATFCLAPPGDTPRRRGFYDAIQLGCIPVVFAEASRSSPLFLSDREIRDMSVLLDASSLDDPSGPEGVFTQLRKLLADAPRMRAAAAAAVTRLHYAYGELTAEDHDTVGPDALDMMLYGLAAPAHGWPAATTDDSS